MNEYRHHISKFEYLGTDIKSTDSETILNVLWLLNLRSNCQLKNIGTFHTSSPTFAIANLLWILSGHWDHPIRLSPQLLNLAASQLTL